MSFSEALLPTSTPSALLCPPITLYDNVRAAFSSTTAPSSCCLERIPLEVLYDVLFPFLRLPDFQALLASSKKLTGSHQLPLSDLTFPDFCCVDHGIFTRSFLLFSDERSERLDAERIEVPRFNGSSICCACAQDVCTGFDERLSNVEGEGVGGITSYAHECQSCEMTYCNACLTNEEMHDCPRCDECAFSSWQKCCEVCDEVCCLECTGGIFCSTCSDFHCDDCYDHVIMCKDCDEFACADCQEDIMICANCECASCCGTISFCGGCGFAHCNEGCEADSDSDETESATSDTPQLLFFDPTPATPAALPAIEIDDDSSSDDDGGYKFL